ncbi:MAG: oxidoreductase [Bacteroidia bacterium]
MRKRSALVFGASGLVGSQLVDLLSAHAAYEAVHVFVRRVPVQTPPGVVVHLVDFDRPDDWADQVRGDDLFCCLGTTMKQAGSRDAFRRVDYELPMTIARIALAQGVGHYLLISSLGSDPHSPIFYSRVKGEVERDLQALPFAHLSILQPSLLLGDRQQQRTGEHLAQRLSPLLDRLFVGPLRVYRAIHARDVARAMIALALHPQPGPIHRSDALQALAAGQ